MDNFYFPMAVKLPPAMSTAKNLANARGKKSVSRRGVSPRAAMDSADRFVTLPPALGGAKGALTSPFHKP